MISRFSKAFTLVELLVAISVIGVLLALLLPAVQSVREAARLTKCKNRMRQIGIGLHNYHDQHGELPPGCLEWRGFDAPDTHRQLAWSAFLLPYIDQSNLHREINFELPFDAVENESAAQVEIPLYLCPSAPQRDLPRGQTDYGGLAGERILDNQPMDGVLVHDDQFAFRQITDGLSSTMAVAEDVGGPDSEWINGRNVFVQAHGINDPDAWVGDNEIRSAHPGSASVLFADAAVVSMADSTDEELLGRLITRAKGEIVNWERP